MNVEERAERVTEIMIVVLDWLCLPKHQKAAVIAALDTWEHDQLAKFVAVYAWLKRACERNDKQLAMERVQSLFADGGSLC